MAKLNPNNYASLEPLSPEELLEHLATFQRNTDAAEADWQDCKDAAKDAKEKFEKLRGKVAMIGRAREAGHALYELKGGELSEDTPDTEGTLDLGEPDDDVVVDLGDDPQSEAEELFPSEEATTGGMRIYPAEQEGQVYQGKSSQGNTCTVKMQVGGWYGRVSGKPISAQVKTAAIAMKAVDAYLDEYVDWNPTVTLDEPEDGPPKADPDPEPEDLTGGV